MTDEELKATKGKLRILRNKYFSELLSDYWGAFQLGEVGSWDQLQQRYIKLTKSEKQVKWRQRDLEEQIAEEKNENPSIEE